MRGHKITIDEILEREVIACEDDLAKLQALVGVVRHWTQMIGFQVRLAEARSAKEEETKS